MKEHLNFKPVEGIQIAIVKKLNDAHAEEWYVYLLNHNEYPIENVLITTKGYGSINGEEKKTSVLRHLIEVVEPKSCALIEPIQPELFELSNEFWVSYYIGKQIFDKKFVFVAGSVSEINFIDVPIVGLRGVLHG